MLLSIPQVMKQGELNFEADEIGLVYPIYGHMPPNMVRKFIKKARLKAEYKFAVLTYGNRKCNASEIWDDISRRAGNAFDYVTTMIMVDNWLPNFDMNEQIKIDKHIPESLARITADVSARRRWIEPVTEEERQQHQGFIAATGIDPEKGFTWDSAQCFTATDACIGCGVLAATGASHRRESRPKANAKPASRAYKTARNVRYSSTRKATLCSPPARRTPTPAIATNTYPCGTSSRPTDSDVSRTQDTAPEQLTYGLRYTARQAASWQKPRAAYRRRRRLYRNGQTRDGLRQPASARCRHGCQDGYCPPA